MFSKTYLSLSAGRKIALLAVFIAFGVVANFVSVDVTPSVKITFTYTVCFFAGLLMGGIPAFLVGFLGDTIGFLIVPSGVFWLYGVTLGLLALIFGVCLNRITFTFRGGQYVSAVIAFAAGYLLVTLLLNSVVNYWYLRLFTWTGDAQKSFSVYLAGYLTGRLIFQSVVFAVNAAACLLLLPFACKLKAALANKHKIT